MIESNALEMLNWTRGCERVYSGHDVINGIDKSVDSFTSSKTI